MPHLVILYTKNLDTEVDMSALCRRMADTMLTVKDEDGKQVYPTGGTRVLAYPAAHSAVADGGAAGKAAGGDGDYAFVYLNLRMGKGRSDATKEESGRRFTGVRKGIF
jgi:5-carboxymethyl-2-hydroxymuconate isomerase